MVRRLVGHQVVLHYVTRGLVVILLAAFSLFVFKSIDPEIYEASKTWVLKGVSSSTGDWIFEEKNRVLRISIGLLLAGLCTVFVLLQTFDRLITRDVQNEVKLFKNLVARTYQHVFLVKKKQVGVVAAWRTSLKAIFSRKKLRKIIWDMAWRTPSWALQKLLYGGDYYRHIIAKYGDALEMLVYEATNSGKEISLTMEDGKVYIGIVISGVKDAHAESKFITILPLKSGFRNDENRTIQITTDYSSFASLRKEEATDLIKVIPVDRIVTIGVYREDLNVYFQEKTRQLKGLSHVTEESSSVSDRNSWGYSENYGERHRELHKERKSVNPRESHDECEFSVYDESSSGLGAVPSEDPKVDSVAEKYVKAKANQVDHSHSELSLEDESNVANRDGSNQDKANLNKVHPEHDEVSD